jgi:hypothetical protein
MVTKNRKWFFLNIALILGLLGGMFGAVPAQASAQTVRNPFSSLGADTKQSTIHSSKLYPDQQH